MKQSMKISYYLCLKYNIFLSIPLDQGPEKFSNFACHKLNFFSSCMSLNYEKYNILVYIYIHKTFINLKA